MLLGLTFGADAAANAREQVHHPGGAGRGAIADPGFQSALAVLGEEQQVIA
jgi:hypothetical protein